MKKIFKFKSNRGMTYVELIVVLSIFAVMTSVVIFNYSAFQAKVDIKNLAADIALKIVQAQKASLSGQLPPAAQQLLLTDPSSWKPSYGVYFVPTATSDTDGIFFNKKFIYFANVVDPVNIVYNGTSVCDSECIDKIIITKGDFISKIESYLGATATLLPNSMTITFIRPDSKANFFSSGLPASFDYIKITIASPNGATAAIEVYPSGRIQVN
jgi:prepilin-type N-terminal cleavage/methylation domain-containing protein